MPLRLVFMGTPDFAVPTLKRIADEGHHIVAAYTRAPKPAGRRGLELQETPVAREAARRGVATLTPASLKGPATAETFRAHGADAAVVVAYGLILPKAILEAVPRGCYNLHASLLPRWRGAAPINRAIMAGDAETGVMVMRMEEGLDTGPVAMTARVSIGADVTAGDLHDDLAQRGAGLMAEALAELERGKLTVTPQATDGVTYAAKIDKAETRIDWRQPWQTVHDHTRGVSPFPGAWCELDGARIRILRTTKGEGAGPPGALLDDAFTVACGSGAVRILELQRAGKQVMAATDFLRGAQLAPGAVLG